MTMGCGSSKKILHDSSSDCKVKTTFYADGNSSREANSSGNNTNAKRKVTENRIKGAKFRARFDASITEKYSVKALIGKGSFCKVFRVEHRTTKHPYAVKVIEIQEGKDVFESELVVLRKVQHDFVLRLYEVFECKNKVYLVMELATGGELFDRIVSRGYFTERDATHVLFMVLEGVRYLHSLGITHRDLKPENLLYYHPGNDSKIMITDFGLSNLRKSPDDSTMDTTCGTPEYIAPEILKSMPYTNSVDMWSIGVISYILLSGSMPFADDSRRQLYRAVVAVTYDYSSKPWDDVTDLAKDFINKLIVLQPEKRMTAEEGLKHPWITSLAASSSFKNLHGSISSNWRKSSSRLNSAKSNRSKRSNQSSKSGRSILSKHRQPLSRQQAKVSDIQEKHATISSVVDSLPDCSEPKGTELKLTKQLAEKLQSVVGAKEAIDVPTQNKQSNPVSQRNAATHSRILERESQQPLQLPSSNQRIHHLEERNNAALSDESPMTDAETSKFSLSPVEKRSFTSNNETPITFQFNYDMQQPTRLHKLSEGDEEMRNSQSSSNYQSTNLALDFKPTKQASQRNNFFSDGLLLPKPFAMDVDVRSDEGTTSSISSAIPFSLDKPVRLKPKMMSPKRNKVTNS